MGFAGRGGQVTTDSLPPDLNEQMIWLPLVSTLHLFSFHAAHLSGYRTEVINSALLKAFECINECDQQLGNTEVLNTWALAAVMFFFFFLFLFLLCFFSQRKVLQICSFWGVALFSVQTRWLQATASQRNCIYNLWGKKKNVGKMCILLSRRLAGFRFYFLINLQIIKLL